MLEVFDPTIITVNSRKYDGSISRSWNAGLISTSNTRYTTIGTFDEDVDHPDLGIIRAGTVSIEYFWTDKWYNIFQFNETDGSLRNYYCNIAMPATVSRESIDFIDLDIDIVQWPEGLTQVLDMDDFEMNSEIYAYPDSVRRLALQAVDHLIEAIKNCDFPFGKATENCFNGSNER
jgi:uncharacterized protein